MSATFPRDTTSRGNALGPKAAERKDPRGLRGALLFGSFLLGEQEKGTLGRGGASRKNAL